MQNFRVGGQIFSEIFLRLFTGVSENLFAFFPKKFSSVLQKFLTTFFYFFVRGQITVAVIILSANFEGGHGRIGPSGSAQVGGPKAAPFGPLDFLQVGGAVQRSRGAAAYPGCMVIRALVITKPAFLTYNVGYNPITTCKGESRGFGSEG